MSKKFALFGMCFFALFGSAFHIYDFEVISPASFAAGKTLVLYEAASGGLPDAPLMNFATFPPGAARPAFSNGATLLDTTTAGRQTYAGWTSTGAATPGFPALDRAAGFQVDFTLQIEDESHRNNNRSGFSLISLGEDARGIELAFWANEIWAQSAQSTGGLFHHGEGVIFQTTTGLIDYQLAVTGDSYTLTANAQPILSGPVRDYSAFEGFPDPYQTPNILFLGDDTASAQARVRLRFVSVTGTEPGTPAVTSTGASTSTTPPATSPIPQPSLTPMPSPVLPGSGIEVCPAGGIFLAATMILPALLKGVRSKSKSCKEDRETTMDQNWLL